MSSKLKESIMRGYALTHTNTQELQRSSRIADELTNFCNVYLPELLKAVEERSKPVSQTEMERVKLIEGYNRRLQDAIALNQKMFDAAMKAWKSSLTPEDKKAYERLGYKPPPV